MSDAYEYGCNPSDEVYATTDDFGPARYEGPEAPVDELPFHIPRD